MNMFIRPMLLLSIVDAARRQVIEANVEEAMPFRKT